MNKGHVFGIDIGSSCIKVFVGRMESSGRIDIVGYGAAPTSGFAKGALVDAQALAAAAKEAVDCALIASSVPLSPAYVGIGGTAIQAFNCKGRVAPAKKGAITQEDVSRACRAASLTTIPDTEQVLHVYPVNCWVDGLEVGIQPVGLSGNSLEVQAHAVTVSKSFYDEVVSSLESVGISVAGMVANAVMNTLVIKPKTGEYSLIIDMGAGTTDIVLCQNGNGNIHFVASLPLGDHYITNDIALGVGVSQSHAEEIKRYYARLDSHLLGKNIVLDCNDYDTTDKHVPYDFLHKIVESRVEELIALVHDFVRPVIACLKVDNVVLTGGCTAMPSIIARLEGAFGVPVEIASLHDVPPEYTRPAYTACHGLIRYGGGRMPVCQEADANPRLSLWSKIKNLF